MAHLKRLYVIRHGKPSATWGGDDDDPGLDETGHAQARAARDWLMALPEDERPTKVVSSPLRRCRETAEPTAQALGVEIEVDPRVGEITSGRVTTVATPVGVRNDRLGLVRSVLNVATDVIGGLLVRNVNEFIWFGL